MTLEQCTKAELIQIIKKTNYLSDRRVKCALLDIEGQRTQKRFKEYCDRYKEHIERSDEK